MKQSLDFMEFVVYCIKYSTETFRLYHTNIQYMGKMQSTYFFSKRRGANDGNRYTILGFYTDEIEVLFPIILPIPSAVSIQLTSI